MQVTKQSTWTRPTASALAAAPVPQGLAGGGSIRPLQPTSSSSLQQHPGLAQPLQPQQSLQPQPLQPQQSLGQSLQQPLRPQGMGQPQVMGGVRRGLAAPLELIDSPAERIYSSMIESTLSDIQIDDTCSGRIIVGGL